MRAYGLVALVVAAACSGGSSSDPRQVDAGRTRRQLPPPPGTVRQLPPYAIDPGGIGPYRLGATADEIYAAMPERIPRIAILDIANVIDASVVRCDADSLLAGARPEQQISFLAALSAGIARTEGGLAVGAWRDAVEAAEPPLIDPRVARDPRVLVPASNPGARFLFDADRVTAILLVGNGAPGATPPGAPPGPPGPPPDAMPADAGPARGCHVGLPAPEAELRAAAQLTQDPARILSACLTPEGREAVVIAGTSITVVEVERDHPRRVAAVELRGLSWASPLRRDGDRDDLIAIAEDRTDDELVVTLVALRLEGGKLVKIAEDPVYRVTRTSAQWIGARLADLDLYVVVEDRPDGYLVGGALVHRAGAGARDVAPLTPATVSRRRRTTSDPPAPLPVDAAPPTDAARRDAGADAGS